MTGHVYVIGSEDNAGPWKIGLTESLADRLGALQACSPVKLAIRCAYQFSEAADAFKVERFAHDMLNSHRIHGEWFTAELQHIIKVVARSSALLNGTPITFTRSTKPPRFQRLSSSPSKASEAVKRSRAKKPEEYRKKHRDYMSKRRAKLRKEQGK